MSGLLADLYSAGDRMKRKLGGLLSNPLETVALGSTRMAEDVNALSALASEAGYMPRTVNRGDQSVLVSERQKALARALLADKGAEMGMAAATVWHGSPHKFDKFDSSKIGTGEGAQAYGHGLYLAESPAVAQTYAPASPQFMQKVSSAVDRATGPKQEVLEMFNKLRLGTGFGSPAGIKQRIERIIENEGASSQYASGLRRAYAQLEKEYLKNPGGQLYKVDLPDNAIARMLDWDKPLSQQAPEVQKAVESVMAKRAAEAEAQRLAMNAQYPGRMTHPILSKIANKPKTAFDYKGEAAVSSLVQELGGPAKAAEYLRSQGIPGVRYLDGGSRTAGSGTSNYVVFPGQEDILTILERNGVRLK